MRSSRWDAQGNIYLVAEEAMSSRESAGVNDADGVLEVISCGEDWVEITIWNPDGSRGRDVRQRHADRGAVARGTQWLGPGDSSGRPH